MAKDTASLKIDPEFKSLIPALRPEELRGLEESIVAEGCRDDLVAWSSPKDDILLDGHNRHAICTKHNIPFNVVIADKVGNRDEAKLWIIDNQLARRNLTTPQRLKLARLKQEAIAALAEKNLKTATGGKAGTTLSKKIKSIDTQEEVAKLAETSKTTAYRYDVIQKDADEKTKAKVDADEVSINEAYKPIAKAKRKEKKEKERKARAKAARQMTLDDDQNIFVGDFRELGKTLADDSVDLIFTDPPYDRESVPLYADLGELAARVLKPGGSLITYLGQYNLPEVMKALDVDGLKFFWTLACQHTGTTRARMREYGIRVTWKPMLWFVKGTSRRDKETFVDDLVISQCEKGHHDWQQSTVEANYYIENLTNPNDLVIDPFCGGGTIAVSAKELGRQWWSCDIDADSVAIARKRTKEVSRGPVS